MLCDPFPRPAVLCAPGLVACLCVCAHASCPWLVGLPFSGLSLFPLGLYSCFGPRAFACVASLSLCFFSRGLRLGSSLLFLPSSLRFALGMLHCIAWLVLACCSRLVASICFSPPLSWLRQLCLALHVLVLAFAWAFATSWPSGRSPALVGFSVVCIEFGLLAALRHSSFVACLRIRDPTKK